MATEAREARAGSLDEGVPEALTVAALKSLTLNSLDMVPFLLRIPKHLNAS